MNPDDSSFLIALGSNLRSIIGSPAQTILRALERLSANGLAVLATSRLYRSPAFPAGSGPDYINGCARLRGAPGQGPEEVLAILHRVEADLGRERAGRWGARPIDLDLIAMGDAVLPDAQTHRLWRDLPVARQMSETPDRAIVPHPRMQDRAFVLIPLAEIAPQWHHPLLEKTVIRMRDDLPEAEKAALVPIDAPFDEDWALVKPC